MTLSKSPYRGTRDFFPADMRLRNYIFKKWSEVSELYAYEPYDGPLLEEVSLYLAKSGEELINEQIYSFKDRGDRHVAIRPELTPTVARMVAQIHREVAKPIRWFSIPNLMRYERTQRGRLREFWQYNADIFGGGTLGEIEILQMAVSLIKSFGATSEHFEILVNDRRHVEMIFKEKVRANEEESKKLYKLIDKSQKIPHDKLVEELKLILNAPTREEAFLSYLSSKDVPEFLKQMQNSGLSEYVKFDPTIVRGLDYYTGLVFEIFDKHPENRRAIAGGGAYANLLQIFNEPSLEGVGIGMGEVPFTLFLTSHGLLPDFTKPEFDVLVAYTHPDAGTVAQKAAAILREANLKTELFLGEAKPKKIYAQTDRKNFNFVILIGEDIQIKNLKTQNVHKLKVEEVDKILGALNGN